ncbi:hypothetical protein CRM22_011130 [Opisthorchis felineus]|uniref:Uncharacterized protein n=1 Tax=Opisthorchis felineus TaxID=147828 RepID=A0A4S2KB85_OPIFE|nr:hypothetical protein CRM22_011130 [Opisthorchis felineus]
MGPSQPPTTPIISVQNATTNVTDGSEPFEGQEYAHVLVLLSSVYTQLLAGLCALVACCVTLHHIYCHLKNYTCYEEQRYIIRILILIPAYAFCSFTSVMLVVHARQNSVYIEPIHDIAEAIAIYSFLALCYQYLGGEGSIMLELAGKTIKSSIFYGTCCFAGKPYTILFLRFCKVATLQYAFIKPFTSLLSIILHTVRKYHVGDFDPNSGYLYLFLINNFTVTLALYGLLLFYFATRDQLRPFKPLLKFATMKAIIFFSFWQDVLFSILEWSHVVSGSQGYPAGLLAAGCKNVLVCIELVITAIALRYAFPYSIYVLHHPPRLVLDLPLGGQDWSVFAGTNPLGQDVVFKESAANVNNKLRTLRADLLIGTSAFAERSPPTNQAQPEPLPWDIAESRLRIDDPEPHTWDGHNSVTLPTISASIKATIDPRDIFVDAVHNFHPNYRHYTQPSQTVFLVDPLQHFVAVFSTVWFNT